MSMTVATLPPVEPATTYLLSGVMNVLCTPRSTRMNFTFSSDTVSMTSTPPSGPWMAT